LHNVDRKFYGSPNFLAKPFNVSRNVMDYIYYISFRIKRMKSACNGNLKQTLAKILLCYFWRILFDS